ncbi:AraC-like DNA-binding protein [Mesorhizobium soli]|uniref:AraC family transcriptional regulator n=1 Tax=Pseudaminobacter soli (ex Li et al. 2025) TaxID=1295366 RepID=UPI0024759DE1|nr:AraC family transcriptional regulator [Mesorhizobium soli]MDH6230504.1 AraC-like DNA-binding protein [Mesorhizobium soli]
MFAMLNAPRMPDEADVLPNRETEDLAPSHAQSQIVVILIDAEGDHDGGAKQPDDALAVVVPLRNGLRPLHSLPTRPDFEAIVDLLRSGACDDNSHPNLQFCRQQNLLRGLTDENGRLPLALAPLMAQPGTGPTSENAALVIKVHFIHRPPSKKGNSVFRGGLAPWQKKRAQKMLRANLDGGVTVSEIAKECGLSVRHFSRAFHESLGMPPRRWLTRHRVETAKKLLLGSGMGLADIAKCSGFSDQSHLTRVFSGWMGESPGSWRRSNALVPLKAGFRQTGGRQA